VLGLVAAAGKPVKAYDLLDLMKSEGGSTAPPTVYRALDFLLEQGFIHRLASVNAFVGCHHPQVRHSVPFLICDDCQNAIELEGHAHFRIAGEPGQGVGLRHPRADPGSARAMRGVRREVGIRAGGGSVKIAVRVLYCINGDPDTPPCTARQRWSLARWVDSLGSVGRCCARSTARCCRSRWPCCRC
jgi:hypothetical protein